MIETKSWTSLIGNSHLTQWFGAALGKGRLGGSFLFVGPHGVGKQTVADLLALTLMCNVRSPQDMAPCGTCEMCTQVCAHTHPDVIRVQKPADKSYIPLDLLIGRPEARMQEGFCRDVRLRPFYGTRKIAILNDADYLNEEGANCLLKTIEEPPANALIILIGTSEQRQLPTIRSRSRIIRFNNLSLKDSAELLRRCHEVDASEQAIESAVSVSAGDIHAAARQLNGQADDTRMSLTSQLSPEHPDPVAITRVITKYVEDAGKEASKRRNAMRDVFSIAIQHYRHQLREGAFNSSLPSKTLARLDRSIRAIQEVDRNANQSTLIECYACDIAMGVSEARGAIG